MGFINKLKTVIAPLAIFIAASIASLYNISGFPMMVGDEGIYVSQAWWLVHFRSLGPFTYWYDHFPLGWAQIGLWQSLTDGPFTFYMSVFSGRVFMGLLHGLTSLFIFKILKERLYISWYISIIATSIFVLSPLSQTFGRLVLLDNIAAFWLTLSLFFTLSAKNNLRTSLFSSLTLGLAILSKESLLFVIPAFLFATWIKTRSLNHQKYLLLISYLTLFFLLALFPLLAFIKNELFPTQGAVSFVDALRFQTIRGSGLPFWNSKSDFAQIFSIWLNIDPIFTIAGFGSLFLSLFLTWKNKFQRITSLYGLFFLLFLIRGGLVYDFYVIPLLPLLTLVIGILIQHLTKLSRLGKYLSLTLIGLPIYLGYSSQYVFTTKATTDQIDSTNYAKTLINKDSVVISDNYSYLDLSLGPDGSVQNPNILWYSKAESDPDVQDKYLSNSPENIDVAIINDSLARKIYGGELPFIAKSLEYLNETKTFGMPSVPTDKPYSNESVTVYYRSIPTLPDSSNLNDQQKLEQQFIISITGTSLDETTKNIIQNSTPWGILINFNNIANSSQLETLLRDISAVKSSKTHLIAYQSDSGQISIPWISTTLRSSFKSPLEATEATKRKSRQLKELGFDSVITTTNTNRDNLLQSIISASYESDIIPILEYSTEDNPSSDVYIYINEKFQPKEIDPGIKPLSILKIVDPNHEKMVELQTLGFNKFYIPIENFVEITKNR